MLHLLYYAHYSIWCYPEISESNKTDNSNKQYGKNNKTYHFTSDYIPLRGI